MSPAQKDGTSTRLQGARLVTARIVWAALVVLILAAYVSSLPDYLAQLQMVCVHAPCAYGQISLSTQGALHTLGLEVGSYAVFSVVLALIIACSAWAVSGVIFWRKSDDWMALLVALLLVVGGTLYVVETEVTGQSAWRLPAQLLGLLTFVVYYLVFSLFPDGRLAPRWTRWLLVAFCTLLVIFSSLFPNPFALPLWLSVSIEVVLFGFYASLVVGQIYRYRHVSGPVQRQQTKWVVYGLTVTVVLIVGGNLPVLLFPQSPYPLVYHPILACTLLLIPLTISIAILRYRLWDIDVIIKRTLVYSTLTGMLTLVYFGLVFACQFLLRGIVTHINDVVIVASTLVTAALFQPLRRPIQNLINRRFYRSTYDAAKTLQAFGTILRQEVDLSQLQEQVVTVVQQTMQPASVSLWLCPPKQRHEEKSEYDSTRD
jgi:hypothetical protein